MHLTTIYNRHFNAAKKHSTNILIQIYTISSTKLRTFV